MADYPAAYARAVAFDEKLRAYAARVSPQYVDLVSLVARQVFGAIDITVLGQSGNTTDATDVKAFMKHRFFSVRTFSLVNLTPLTNESQAGQPCRAFVRRIPRIPVLERISRRSVARTPSGIPRCHFGTPVCSARYRCVIYPLGVSATSRVNVPQASAIRTPRVLMVPIRRALNVSLRRT